MLSQIPFAIIIAVVLLTALPVLAEPKVSAAVLNSSGVITSVADTKKPTVKNVGPDEFDRLRKEKNTVILDVRTPKEFAQGHLTGATNIDFQASDFATRIKALDPDKTYLVHCAGGVRSAKACAQMSQGKFANLINLEGGMKAWERAGKPVEK